MWTRTRDFGPIKRNDEHPRPSQMEGIRHPGPEQSSEQTKSDRKAAMVETRSVERKAGENTAGFARRIIQKISARARRTSRRHTAGHPAALTFSAAFHSLTKCAIECEAKTNEQGGFASINTVQIWRAPNTKQVLKFRKTPCPAYETIWTNEDAHAHLFLLRLPRASL